MIVEVRGLHDCFYAHGHARIGRALISKWVHDSPTCLSSKLSLVHNNFLQFLITSKQLQISLFIYQQLTFMEILQQKASSSFILPVTLRVNVHTNFLQGASSRIFYFYWVLQESLQRGKVFWNLSSRNAFLTYFFYPITTAIIYKKVVLSITKRNIDEG